METTVLNQIHQGSTSFCLKSGICKAIVPPCRPHSSRALVSSRRGSSAAGLQPRRPPPPICCRPAALHTFHASAQAVPPSGTSPPTASSGPQPRTYKVSLVPVSPDTSRSAFCRDLQNSRRPPSPCRRSVPDRKNRLHGSSRGPPDETPLHWCI